jgi:serine/threonine protein phosphatase PrpC
MTTLNPIEQIAQLFARSTEVFGGDDSGLEPLGEAFLAVWDAEAEPTPALQTLGLRRLRDGIVVDSLTPLADMKVVSGESDDVPDRRKALRRLAAILDALGRDHGLIALVPSMWRALPSGDWVVNWLALKPLFSTPGVSGLSVAQRRHQRELPDVLRLHPFPDGFRPALALRHALARLILGSIDPRIGAAERASAHLDVLRALRPGLAASVPRLLNAALTAPFDEDVADPCATLVGELLDALARPAAQEPRALVHRSEGDSRRGKAKVGPNQDVDVCMPDPPAGLSVVGVLDGVSTATLGSGERAAGIAREALLDRFDLLRADPGAVADPAAWPASVGGWLQETLQAASDAIAEKTLKVAEARKLDPLDAIGMTCAGGLAVAVGDRAMVATVGDVYAWRYEAATGQLDQISVPQTEAVRALLSGEVTLDGLGSVEGGERLFGVLGRLVADEESGAPRPETINPTFVTCTFAPGDALLIASDGLPDSLRADGPFQRAARIAAVLRRELTASGDPKAAVEALVRAADEEDSVDNITARLLSFGEPLAAAPAPAPAPVPAPITNHEVSSQADLPAASLRHEVGAFMATGANKSGRSNKSSHDGRNR